MIATIANLHETWTTILINVNTLLLHVHLLEENLSITTTCCDLAIATHGDILYKYIMILVVNQRVLVVGWQLSKTAPKPSGCNQNDLFMHFLAMSSDGQVTTDGCNKQVTSNDCTLCCLWETPI